MKITAQEIEMQRLDITTFAPGHYFFFKFATMKTDNSALESW